MDDVAPIQTKPPATAPAGAAPTIVTFAVSDPEVLLALSDFPEGAARTNFLVTALKVGVLSLKAARGTLDADTVRREGERLMESLGERLNSWRARFEERVTGSLQMYFSPTDGVFTERVSRLTRDDGEIASVMRGQVKEAQENLARVFEQFIGENSRLLKVLDPSGENELVLLLQRTLDGVVQAQTLQMTSQFSLDNKDGALSRFMGELQERHGDLTKALATNMSSVVAEFDLNKEGSALSRLVARVDETQRRLSSELSLDAEGSALKRLQQMLQEHQRVNVESNVRLAEQLNSAVQALQARRDEAAKSTRHGLEFEAALGEHLRSQVAAAGDVVEDTGASTGLISHCKVGDHVITIGPEKLAAGAKIVVEAKESASYDLKKTLEEADIARRNRGAGVCVFVHSVRTAHDSIPLFQRYGHDLVVRWDAEDAAGDVWLQAALMVATALSVKAAQHGKQEARSYQKIDKAIERIRKTVEDFGAIETSANSAKTAAEKILGKAASMRSDMEAQIEILLGEFTKVKARDEEEAG